MCNSCRSIWLTFDWKFRGQNYKTTKFLRDFFYQKGLHALFRLTEKQATALFQNQNMITDVFRLVVLIQNRCSPSSRRLGEGGGVWFQLTPCPWVMGGVENSRLIPRGWFLDFSYQASWTLKFSKRQCRWNKVAIVPHFCPHPKIFFAHKIGPSLCSLWLRSCQDKEENLTVDGSGRKRDAKPPIFWMFRRHHWRKT